jgi:hypothetical protein
MLKKAGAEAPAVTIAQGVTRWGKGQLVGSIDFELGSVSHPRLRLDGSAPVHEARDMPEVFFDVLLTDPTSRNYSAG